MSYTRGVPQATDRIADTQSPIQTNFNLIDTDFGVDHVSYSGLTNQAPDAGSHGYHQKMTMPDLNASPPTSPASFGLQYAKHQTADSSSFIFPYWNQKATSVVYPLLPIRAAATFTYSSTAPSIQQSFNVASVTASGYTTGGNPGVKYTITFTDQVYTNGGTNPYMVMVTVGQDLSAVSTSFTVVSYTGRSPTGFNITATRESGSTNPDTISFIVIQI